MIWRVSSDALASIVVALSGSVAAVVGVAGTVIRAGRGSGGRRNQIKLNLEIIQMLPAGSEVKPRLQEQIEHSLLRLIETEGERRRDPSGIVLALLFLLGGGWAASVPVRGGSPYWWLLAIPLGVVGVVGLSQDAVRRKRDESGRPIGLADKGS